MRWSLDARLPLTFAADRNPPAGRDAAYLVETGQAAPPGAPSAAFTAPARGGHAPGCACCVDRGPVAAALDRLFLARVRGEVAHFSRVVALTGTATGRAAVRAALAADPVLSARYRLEE